MKNKMILAVIVSVFAIGAYAGERVQNAYKTSKLSTVSVLVSCNDERVPSIQHFENSTYIIVTCKP